MSSTWTDLADGAVGDQLTAALWTAAADNLDFLRNPPSDIYTPSLADANITTSSTTFVDLTGFSITLTTQGGKILVFFRLRANSTNVRWDVLLDGLSVTGDNDALGGVTPASTFGMNTCFLILAASAGVHTLKIQTRVTTGTLTVYPAGLCQFAAWEIGNIA
jgi:hypothetical protein